MSAKKSFRKPDFFDTMISGQPPELSPVKPATVESSTIEQPAVASPPKKPALYRTARKLTLYFSEDVAIRAKKAAIDRHVTLSEWLEDAARRQLQDDAEEQ